MEDATIYGESARAILGTLAKSKHRVADSGMHTFHLRMTPTDAGPVARAIMRAEAELLLEDADAFDSLGECRTPEQRRADAFVEVVEAAAAALQI